MIGREAVAFLDDEILDLGGGERHVAQDIVVDGDVLVCHFQANHDGMAG